VTSVHELIFCISDTTGFGGFIYVALYYVFALLVTHDHLIIVSNELAASVSREEGGIFTPKMKVACLSERLVIIYVNISTVLYLRIQ
jgi:hypothetical protein